MISAYAPFVGPKEKEMPYYLTTVGNPKYQPPVFRPNGLNDHMFLYFVSGEAVGYIGDREYEIKKGMMLYTPPGVEHNYHMKENYGETWYISFNGNGLCDFLGDKALVFKIDENYDVVAQYENFVKLRENPQEYRNISKALYNFILDMDMFIKKSSVYGGEKRNIIFEATNFILENNDVTLCEISDKYNISKEYFCRLFKNYTGYTMIEYVNTLKIQNAKKMLRETNKSICEISKLAGFQSHSYFLLEFRKFTGISPLQFRENSDRLEL